MGCLFVCLFPLLILPVPSTFFSFSTSHVQAPRRLPDLEVLVAQQRASLAWMEKACSPRSCQEEQLSRPANWERVGPNAISWRTKNRLIHLQTNLLFSPSSYLWVWQEVHLFLLRC